MALSARMLQHVVALQPVAPSVLWPRRAPDIKMKCFDVPTKMASFIKLLARVGR